MHITFIGKYPPIEGGVSSDSYWLCNGLAKLGHTVHVVTNAPEVERPYRMYLGESDAEFLCPKYSSGSITVRTVEHFTRRRMSHIPATNPYVSRLASVAAQIAKENSSSAIFAYYLEPYGVAAHLASTWLDLPYVVRHAGSDFDRLMTVSDLAATYRRVFTDAEAIITRSDLSSRFFRMGIWPDRLVSNLASSVPDIFCPTGAALDVDSIREGAVKAGLIDIQSPPGPGRRFDPSLPTVGIYGKIGTFKGSFDLLEALCVLKKEQILFNLVCLASGDELPRFLKSVERHDLYSQTWVLPFLPNWKIPDFIRGCTVVCFLERDFPVAIHGPQVPREVMKCGRCLIVSREIARKQGYLFEMEDGSSPPALICEDPKDHASLATLLRDVLINPEISRSCGVAAFTRLSEHVSTDNGVTVLETAIRDAVMRKDKKGDRAPLQTGDLDLVLTQLLPWSAALMREFKCELWEVTVAEHLKQVHQRPLDVAAAICSSLLALIRDTAHPIDVPSYAETVVQFEQAQINLFRNHEVWLDPFGFGDQLNDGVLTADMLKVYRPVRNRFCEVFTTAYDFAELQNLFVHKQRCTAEVSAAASTILMIPQTNYSLILLSLSSSAMRVWQLCDGLRSLNDIVSTMVDGAPIGESKLIEFVRHLYSRKALAFADAPTVTACQAGVR